jgi:hypothetical protein
MTRLQGAGIDSDSPVVVFWDLEPFDQETGFFTALLALYFFDYD